MAAAADKFSRLAALKPARPMPARPAAIRTPGEEDVLGTLLGAGVATNHFGEHLAVRNWFSTRSEEHTSELQSLTNLVCRLLLEKKKKNQRKYNPYKKN